MHRRSFTAALTASLAVPALAAAAPAAADEKSGRTAPGLAAHMRTALTRELDDRTTARALTPDLMDVGFDWHPETAPLHRVDFVIAYGFGNRPAVGGGDPAKTLPEPGPVNEALADTVARIRADRDIPVYAQWEIARFLDSKHHMDGVTSIEPVIAEDGTITYLSTDGVAAQVADARKDLPGGVGTACVVGFRDHHKRCVQTTRALGMAAFAPRGFAMPHTYDRDSGQPWTRNRELYLVHDMAAQWQFLRAKMIAEAYPNG
ncbi:hypothetical protein ACH4SP_03460 [Streptomyces sp. NPDC021093]|uniref:hypothetical protein n=1 Tax=Streptomyces sp. NPDC021093 TaxID=3365112 RepID=UPI0037B69947